MSNTKVREPRPSEPGKVDRQRDDILTALRDVRGLSILDGVFITKTLTAATHTVSHGLGRRPQGVIVTKKPASSLGYYWEAPTTKTIDITVAAAGDWTFWVF